MTSRDEVGQLGAAFNEMLDALDAREEERDRAERALRRSEEAERFLAEATAQLAESLDYETTLRTLPALTVPILGDLAVLCLPVSDTTFEVVAGAGRGDGLEQAGPLAARPGGAHPVVDAVREAAPHMVPELGSTDDALLGPLYERGVRRLLAVPLLERGEVRAVLVCGRVDGEPYVGADASLAWELVRRAGIAVENAVLYRQAQDAVRVRDDFLAVASHELRTPLAGLMLQVEHSLRVERATSQAPGQAARLVALERMDKQLRRLGRLIDNLLDVARLTAGRLSLELEPVDLAAVVTEVAARFEPESAVSGSDLRVRAPEPVVGRWDRLRLEQVATNLLSNALKYGAGRPIDIEVDEHEGLARLVVRDRGIGIAAHDVERIFAPFERAVSLRHFGGLGLGLHITRQIVESLGGTIRVESAPGAGSSFVVALPCGGPRTQGPPGTPQPT